MTSRERFLRTLGGQPVDRPPVWLMRQAGRYLPEYRELKERHPFRELVSQPDLATEVTLQPLRRFPLDAAILFSDILVVPEALGFPYEFSEGGGIRLERRFEGRNDLPAIRPDEAVATIGYVAEAVRILRQRLRQGHALLGFSGAPWTLALYLVEGGAPGEGSRLRAMLRSDPDTVRELLEVLTETVALHLRRQVEAGADAVQLFDSWASLCPHDFFEAACVEPVRRIAAALPPGVFIHFPRGVAHRLNAFPSAGAAALGIDWTTPLSHARGALPAGYPLQGNLDPALLEVPPPAVEAAAARLLAEWTPEQPLIVNLGHGITPRARPESVAALIRAVTSHAATGSIAR